MFTLDKDGNPVAGSCAADAAGAKTSPRGAVIRPRFPGAGEHARDLASAGQALGPGAPSAEELRKLQDMKVQVAEDAGKGLMPNEPVDYMRHFQVESRDEAWASRVESYIDAKMAMVPLARAGISRPIVRCAASICEIAVVQDAAAAQDAGENWQARFLSAMDSENAFLGVVDRAIFARALDDGKIGYVSYLLFDR